MGTCFFLNYNFFRCSHWNWKVLHLQSSIELVPHDIPLAIFHPAAMIRETPERFFSLVARGYASPTRVLIDHRLADSPELHHVSVFYINNYCHPYSYLVNFCILLIYRRRAELEASCLLDQGRGHDEASGWVLEASSLGPPRLWLSHRSWSYLLGTTFSESSLSSSTSKKISQTIKLIILL